MSNLPIQFTDKENSPALLAFMQQFGEHTYVDAELINKFRDALNELHVSLNPNRIISTGTEIKDGNQYTYVDYQWMINGQLFENYNRPLSILINPTTPGYKRNDIGILTNSGDIMQVQGEETNGEVVTSPDVPPGAILLKIYNVVGDQITIDPTPIIVGNEFVEKTDFNPYNSNVTGTDAIIPLDPNGYSEIRLTNTGLISIAGYDLSLILGNPNAKSPYPGKPFIILNLTGHDVVIKKELPTADYPFYFSEESDLVFPKNHYIYASFDPSGFRIIFKSWVDLSTKLDKSSTPSSVYTTDAEGLQVMKPISEFQPVGNYVTTDTTQTVTGNKTFNDVGLIKKYKTYLLPGQSGGYFYIGGTSGYDSFEFISLDGEDSDGFGSSRIYSNPERGNFISHDSLNGKFGSVLKINQYDTYLRNLYAGNITSLYVDGKNSKIKIEGTQNKFADLGTSLITGTKNFEFPNQSGTLALLSDLTDTQNALNLKLPIESPSTTGTVISFTTDRVYGTLTTPETGNITADVTNAKLGVTNIIIHNSGTAPTFDSKFKKLSGSGNYVTGVVNYIYCTYISTTEIIYSINQRA